MHLHEANAQVHAEAQKYAQTQQFSRILGGVLPKQPEVQQCLKLMDQIPLPKEVRAWLETAGFFVNPLGGPLPEIPSIPSIPGINNINIPGLGNLGSLLGQNTNDKDDDDDFDWEPIPLIDDFDDSVSRDDSGGYRSDNGYSGYDNSRYRNYDYNNYGYYGYY